MTKSEWVERINDAGRAESNEGASRMIGSVIDAIVREERERCAYISGTEFLAIGHESVAAEAIVRRAREEITKRIRGA